MTTYDFDRVKMRQRNISSGTFECMVYREWRNPREVTIFTSSTYKWEYLNAMGLTTSPKTKVYIPQRWNKAEFYTMWRFNAVRLESVDYNEFWEWRRSYSIEIDAFQGTEYLGGANLLNPNDFDILRPVVEFCVKHNINKPSLDTHAGNWLRCPVTGHIYPYDIMHIPRDLEKIR